MIKKQKKRPKPIEIYQRIIEILKTGTFDDFLKEFGSDYEESSLPIVKMISEAYQKGFDKKTVHIYTEPLPEAIALFACLKDIYPVSIVRSPWRAIGDPNFLIPPMEELHIFTCSAYNFGRLTDEYPRNTFTPDLYTISIANLLTGNKLTPSQLSFVWYNGTISPVADIECVIGKEISKGEPFSVPISIMPKGIVYHFSDNHESVFVEEQGHSREKLLMLKRGKSINS